MTLQPKEKARIDLHGNTKVGTNLDERGWNFAVTQEASAELRTHEKTPRAPLETKAIAAGEDERGLILSKSGSERVRLAISDGERERWAPMSAEVKPDMA